MSALGAVQSKEVIDAGFWRPEQTRYIALRWTRVLVPELRAAEPIVHATVFCLGTARPKPFAQTSQSAHQLLSETRHDEEQ